jgi:predicted dithiol-disulfide oxidoreductase (DUF899 family)
VRRVSSAWGNCPIFRPGQDDARRCYGRSVSVKLSYARGTDLVIGTYNWLDLTARGRQEDWEQPPGRSDSPLMGWLRHHDRYGT